MSDNKQKMTIITGVTTQEVEVGVDDELKWTIYNSCGEREEVECYDTGFGKIIGATEEVVLKTGNLPKALFFSKMKESSSRSLYKDLDDENKQLRKNLEVFEQALDKVSYKSAELETKITFSPFLKRLRYAFTGKLG